jgi:antitoxin component of RelBE/YafQ-DinJ toxin-antitoxin module
MTQPAVVQLRMPKSMKESIARLAKEDGVSMNQMITLTLAEKVAARDAIEYFRRRAARADYEWFREFMNREGGEPPREGDELPEGYVRKKW